VKRLDRHLLILFVLVALYTAVFSTLWIMRHRALFSYEFEDDAGRNQMIYNVFHGRPFYSTVKGVYLGGHASIVWAVLAVPALVYPGIETSCVVLSLGLGLTVVPVYLVAREVLKSRWQALLLGGAFLLYAPLHAINLHTLNAVTPAVPLLAWAYWAFHLKRLRAFLVFALLAMLCKENVALAVGMFGVVALVKRRPWVWSVIPIAAAGLWLVVAFKVILPGTYTRPLRPTSWFIGARESAAAGGPGGVSGSLLWIASHPGEALTRMLGPDRWLLFGQLFGPVLLVCFLAPGALAVALPAFGQLLMHEGMLPLYHRHWIAPTLPFIMMATVFGCARAKRLLQSRSGEARSVTGLVLAVVLVGCLASNVAPNIMGHMRVHAWGRPEPPPAMQRAATVYDPVFRRETERSRTARDLIRRIPPDASVTASGDLLVPLSARRALYVFLDTDSPWQEADYALINTRAVYFGAGRYPLALRRTDALPPEVLPELHRRRVVALIEAWVASGTWSLVEQRGDIYLLKRRRDG